MVIAMRPSLSLSATHFTFFKPAQPRLTDVCIALIKRIWMSISNLSQKFVSLLVMDINCFHKPVLSEIYYLLWPNFLRGLVSGGCTSMAYCITTGEGTGLGRVQSVPSFVYDVYYHILNVCSGL